MTSFWRTVPIQRSAKPYRYEFFFYDCPKPGPWYSTSYIVVLFVFKDLRWVVVVRFFDIGGIVEHLCLNSLLEEEKMSSILIILKVGPKLIRYEGQKGKGVIKKKKIWIHFQQYFSYIVTVSFIDGGNQSTWRKPQTCQK